MRRFKPKKLAVLQRTLDRLAVISFARALRLVNRKPLVESDPQTNPGKLTEPYILYDELRKVRSQILELERERTEAIILAHRTYG